MSIRTSLAFAALVAAASPLAAQGRGHDGDKVPRGHLPPAGMCRIWIDGVPPGRQPEPTDCATARRQVPRNATVVYGERTTASRYDDRPSYRRDRDGAYDDERDDRKYESRRKAAVRVVQKGHDSGGKVADRKHDGPDLKESDRKESAREATTRKR